MTAQVEHTAARRRARRRHPIRRFHLPLRGTIFCIDWVLRLWYRVHAFSGDDEDLLRIAVGRAEHALVLPDGTRIAADDAVIELHIWNERVLRLGRPGSSLGWGCRVRRRLDHSLRNLAVHISDEPSLQDCKALRARTIFPAARGTATALGIAGRFGLTRLRGGATAPLGETLVGLGLAWACNPHGLAGKPFRRERNELWISQAMFVARYAAAQPSFSNGARHAANAINGSDRAPHAIHQDREVLPAGHASLAEDRPPGY
jgi:hypothetical protein